ncbi:MAG: hypothetical protein COT14_01840 [Candidatus Diapherotrites archaeon CG08_land_8_20_14_0_20_30_16]|nr:MAG: hypothetical protein COT14_01840 [Candidatus Diapherotrites archaeon CG08_land_8_20_14_0_20_30_16]
MVKKNEQAYADRKYILDRLSNPKEREVTIKFLSQLTKLTEEQLNSATFEENKNTPAINIFVPTEDWGNLNTTAYSIPSKHDLQINIIFAPKGFALKAIAHEEEHNKTNLMRYTSEINNYLAVKNLMLTELISIFFDVLSSNSKLTKDQGIAEIQLRFTRFYIDYYLDHYLKSKPNLTNEEKQEIKDKTLDELSSKLHAISNALDTLTAQEIMLVLRQSSWDKVERALKERVLLKQKHIKKKSKRLSV